MKCKVVEVVILEEAELLVRIQSSFTEESIPCCFENIGFWISRLFEMKAYFSHWCIVRGAFILIPWN